MDRTIEMASAQSGARPHTNRIISRLQRISDQIYRNTEQWIENRITHARNSANLKYFILLFAIYLVAILPTIRANFNYIDDQGRALWGIDGWGSSFSRYTSDFLSHIIHASSYLNDISPIPQLIAIAFMAAASTIIITAFREQDDAGFSLWLLIAVIPLGLCPYFLEPLSYKYDSPYMALSVLASVLPLPVWKRHPRVYALLVFACTLLMCTTYQASSGIFPMICLMLALIRWNTGDKVAGILRFLIFSAMPYALGMLVFKFIIMKPVNGYVSNSLASPAQILQHYRTYISLVLSDFNKGWLVIIVMLVIWLVMACALTSTHDRITSFLVFAVAIPLLFLLSFGLYPMLVAPLTAPRAMYGVGAWIALVAVGATITTRNIGVWVPRILTIVLAWTFITFAASYGNALSAQNTWDSFRRDEAVQGLTSLTEFNDGKTKTVRLIGDAGLSPLILHKHNHMFDRLVPGLFRGGWAHGEIQFCGYYRIPNMVCNDSADITDYESWPLLQDTSYHRIYAKNDIFVVIIK